MADLPTKQAPGISLWSSPFLVYTTPAGAIAGDSWISSRFAQVSAPVEIGVATPTATYSYGGVNDDTIYLTARDWDGDQQISVLAATTGPVPAILAQAAGAVFSSTAQQASDGLFWWTPGAVAGTYELEFEAYTDSPGLIPSATPAIALSGDVVTLATGVSSVTSWSFTANANDLVYTYATQTSATRENIVLQVFSPTGQALTSPHVVVTGAPLTTLARVNYSAATGAFTLVQTTTVDGGVGFAFSTINLTTGALETPVYQAFPTPAFAHSDPITITSFVLRPLSDDDILEFVGWEDTSGGTTFAGITTRLLSASFVDITATTSTFQSGGVDTIGFGLDVIKWSTAALANGDTILVYAANNVVNITEFAANGNQLGTYGFFPGNGADGVDPMSFDSIVAMGSRFEITYNVENNSGGQDVYGVIYDTATQGASYTIDDALDPTGQWVGTPFDDVVTYGAGVNVINGGGGTDIFVATNFSASQVSVTIDANGNVVLSDGAGDVDTLERFSTIEFDDATISISGDVLTQTNSDGSTFVSTFNIAGEPYASDAVLRASNSQTEVEVFYKAGGSFYFEYSSSVSVAGFLGYQATLDTISGGFDVDDTAANVAASFNALNADTHLAAITFTDVGTATLKLTVSEALNDSAAFDAITDGLSHSAGATPPSAIPEAEADGALTIVTPIWPSGGFNLQELPGVAATITYVLPAPSYGHPTEASSLGLSGNPYTIEVSDTAADVSAAFDALNADANISAIDLTDPELGTLTLTIAQVFDDTSALSLVRDDTPFGLLTNGEATISTEPSFSLGDTYAPGGGVPIDGVTQGGAGGYTIDVVDTAAHLAALTAAEIAALAAQHVSELTSTNGDIRFTWSQSAAIKAAGMILSAPANDLARESFSDGSSLVYDYGPTDALVKIVTTQADGTFDDRYVNAPGVFNGVTYVSYDAGFTAAGVRDSDTYYNWVGGVLASETFTGNGGYLILIGGGEIKQRTVQSDDAFDVHYFDAPGTIDGVSYAGYDTAFRAAGVRDGETYFDAEGQTLASQTFTGNGDFNFYVDSVLREQKTVDTDGAYQAAFFPAQPSPAYQNDFSAAGVELAHSVDDNSTSGSLNIMGGGLLISQASGEIGPAISPDDFSFTSHASETYTFLAGAADDTLSLAPGFGTATIKGFAVGGANGDALNLSALFTTFADAQGAMKTSGSNTVITDAAHDSLTLMGVLPGSLTAAELGFR